MLLISLSVLTMRENESIMHCKTFFTLEFLASPEKRNKHRKMEQNIHFKFFVAEKCGKRFSFRRIYCLICLVEQKYRWRKDTSLVHKLNSFTQNAATCDFCIKRQNPPRLHLFVINLSFFTEINPLTN